MAATHSSSVTGCRTMFGLILMAMLLAWSPSCWASSWQENVRPIMYVPYGKNHPKFIYICYCFCFYSILVNTFILRVRKKAALCACWWFSPVCPERKWSIRPILLLFFPSMLFLVFVSPHFSRLPKKPEGEEKILLLPAAVACLPSFLRTSSLQMVTWCVLFSILASKQGGRNGREIY